MIMRNPSIAVGFVVAAITVGCSFHVGTDDPKAPARPVTPAPPAAAAPAPARTGPTVSALGRAQRTGPAPGATAAPATPATPTPFTPGVPVLAGTNVFGSGTPDAAGWKGSFYIIPAGTQKLPALSTMTPNGVLFAHELNVPTKGMQGGFPGIDPTRNENFAIRWEAPLIVDTEADYTFHILSDDGAVVNIDGTLIVDNDGAHGPLDKSGPVHLVKGTHGISVDYFQTSGSVALQLFCKKANAAETICPTHLL
jgi:hypothetical protein